MRKLALMFLFLSLFLSGVSTASAKSLSLSCTITNENNSDDNAYLDYYIDFGSSRTQSSLGMGKLKSISATTYNIEHDPLVDDSRYGGNIEFHVIIKAQIDRYDGQILATVKNDPYSVTDRGLKLESGGSRQKYLGNCSKISQDNLNFSVKTQKF